MFKSLEYAYGHKDGVIAMGAIANKGHKTEKRAQVTFPDGKLFLTKEDRASAREVLIKNLRQDNGS